MPYAAEAFSSATTLSWRIASFQTTRRAVQTAAAAFVCSTPASSRTASSWPIPSRRAAAAGYSRRTVPRCTARSSAAIPPRPAAASTWKTTTASSSTARWRTIPRHCSAQTSTEPRKPRFSTRLSRVGSSPRKAATTRLRSLTPFPVFAMRQTATTRSRGRRSASTPARPMR